MTTSKQASLFAGYRFPAEIIAHVVWFYFRFPLSLRIVDEMLAARGIVISHETVRQWAVKFGLLFLQERFVVDSQRMATSGTSMRW